MNSNSFRCLNEDLAFEMWTKGRLAEVSRRLTNVSATGGV
jgi:hypothetical protein